jgi:hypothetical protein
MTSIEGSLTHLVTSSVMDRRIYKGYIEMAIQVEKLNVQPDGYIKSQFDFLEDLLIEDHENIKYVIVRTRDSSGQELVIRFLPNQNSVYPITSKSIGENVWVSPHESLPQDSIEIICDAVCYENPSILICPIRIKMVEVSFKVELEFHQKTQPPPTTIYAKSFLSQFLEWFKTSTFPMLKSYNPQMQFETICKLVDPNIEHGTILQELKDTEVYDDLKPLIASYGRESFHPVTIQDKTQPDEISISLSPFVIPVSGNNYYVFYIQEQDLSKISSVKLCVSNALLINMDPLWVLTRNRELHKSDMLILPIPPLVEYTPWNLVIKFKYPTAEESKPYIWTKKSKSLTPLTHPYNLKFTKCNYNVNNSIVTFIGNERHLFNDRSTSHLITKWWIVPTLNGEPLPVSSPHVIKSLVLTLNGKVRYSGDGKYFSTIVPMLFYQKVHPQYLVYQVILQNTPIIFPYDTNYIQEESEPLEKHHFSSLSASRINSIDFDIRWDVDVCNRLCDNNSQTLNLNFFSESTNVMFSDNSNTFGYFLN